VGALRPAADQRRGSRARPLHRGFVAARVAGGVIRVNAPIIGPADLPELDSENVPNSLYPLSEEWGSSLVAARVPAQLCLDSFHLRFSVGVHRPLVVDFEERPDPLAIDGLVGCLRRVE